MRFGMRLRGRGLVGGFERSGLAGGAIGFAYVYCVLLFQIPCGWEELEMEFLCYFRITVQ